MNNLRHLKSSEIPENQFSYNFQSNEEPNYRQNHSTNTGRAFSNLYPVSRPICAPTNIYRPAQYPTNNYLLQNNNPHYNMLQTSLFEYGNNHVPQQSNNFPMFDNTVNADFATQSVNFSASNNANRNVTYSTPDIQVTPPTKAVKPNSCSGIYNDVDKNIEKNCAQTEKQQIEPNRANISQKRQWGFDNDESENKKKSYFPETKVFTGTIEYIFRWKKLKLPFHCLYQTIATCLSVKQGMRPLSKLLLIRDEKGPVMQVIFYEMDYKLPMIQPGQLIRCVGRMIGANKLHAISIKEAQINDKETLQRLTFISNHAINRSLKSAQ